MTDAALKRRAMTTRRGNSAKSEAATLVRGTPRLAAQWWAWMALDHMGADESFGRDWICNCGSCMAARAAIREDGRTL